MTGALRGSFRSVLLGWTDPVSGERLTVRMRGEPGLLDSLAPLGFEVLAGEEPAGRGGRPHGGHVWTFQAQRAPRVRSLRSRLAPRGGPRGGAAAG